MPNFHCVFKTWQFFYEYVLFKHVIKIKYYKQSWCLVFVLISKQLLGRYYSLAKCIIQSLSKTEECILGFKKTQFFKKQNTCKYVEILKVL